MASKNAPKVFEGSFFGVRVEFKSALNASRRQSQRFIGLQSKCPTRTAFSSGQQQQQQQALVISSRQVSVLALAPLEAARGADHLVYHQDCVMEPSDSMHSLRSSMQIDCCCTNDGMCSLCACSAA